MASSSDLNSTCELLRQLSELTRTVSRDDNNPAANSSSGQLAGFDSAKYLLREVVNPALCDACREAVSPNSTVMSTTDPQQIESLYSESSAARCTKVNKDIERLQQIHKMLYSSFYDLLQRNHNKSK